MKQTSENRRTSEQVVKDIRRATRKQYSAEEKIRIVLDGLRGEYSIAELCRREGIAESLYYAWSKEFLKAGVNGLAKLHHAGSFEAHKKDREPCGFPVINGFLHSTPVAFLIDQVVSTSPVSGSIAASA